MQPNNNSLGPRDNKGTVLDITQGGYQNIPATPSQDEVHPSPLANPFHFNKKAFLVTTLLVILVSFFGTLAFVLSNRSSDKHASDKKINNYAVSDLQIGQDSTGQIQVGAENLTVNGELQIARTAVITPTEAPSKPITGQIYYDKDTNSLYYYNGTKFVNLAQASVTSIDGTDGEITLGEGLQMAGGQLALAPNILDSAGGSVTSFQGKTGAVTLVAGSGINIQGTTITNSGVTSVKGANGLDVSTAGGKVVVSLPQQLSTGSSPTFGGLSLASALGISSGGTGASSYTSGGVIYYNGTSFASTTAPGSDGLCLRSAPGGPAFSACPGASSGDGVSVNAADATDANFINTAATNAVAGTTWSLNTSASPDEISLSIAAADATHAGIITATGTQVFGGNKEFNGLVTAKGNLTIEAGDTFTFNGDAFTDLTGNGLQVTSNTLTLKLESSKGLAVDGNGLSLVDCATDQILKYNGSNQWVCAADADTDTDTTGITSLTPDDSLTVDDTDPDNLTIAVNLQPGYGLALLDNGIGLIDTCDNGEVLKYNTGTPGWECAEDSGSSGLGDDVYVNDSTADNANFIDTSADSTTAGTTWSLTADPGNPDQITLAIAAADATHAGIVTANAQTFGGDKTFNGLITAEGGITFGTNDTLTIAGDALKDLTGDGLQVTTNALNLKLEASKGLAVDGSGLSLIDCATNQILKYNGSSQWDCSADDAGVGDGEGITSINPDDDSITVTGDSSTAGLSVNLRSDFGLQTYVGEGIGLIDSCDNGEVLKYNTTTPGWECAEDSGSSGLGDDVSVNGSAAANANFLDTTADTTTAATTWSLNTAASPDEITLSIAAADATHAGIVTADTQTFGGDKTFNGLITAAAGLTLNSNQNLTIAGDVFKDLTGNGLQITSNTLSLHIQNNKGLESDTNGLSLIDCNNNEILKYSTGTSQWACAADTDTDTTGITSLTPDDSLTVDDTDPNNLTIAVNLQSDYGLKLLSSGIGLTDDCDNGEVLKYNTGTPGWECGGDSDSSGDSVTLQSAYGNDTNGSDAIIALTAADDSIVIQNPASGGTDSSFAFKINQLSTGAVEGLRIESAGSSNLLTIRDTTATAADVFTIADGGATTVKSQTDSTAAFQVQKSDSTPILVVDTQNSQVAVGASAVPANGVLTIGTNTTANTGGAYFGTDTNLYRSGINALKTDGQLTIGNGLQFSVGSGAPDTTLSRSGAAELTTNGDLVIQGGDLLTNQTTFNLLNATATTINFGGAATAFAIGSSSGATITGGGALTLQTASGAALSLDSGTTGALNIGTGSNAKTITIGNGTGATSLTLNAGTGAINIGTNAVAHAVTIGSTTGGAAVTLQAGTGGFSITTQGTGALAIGNNAVAQTLNIGNGTGATSVSVLCGTGTCGFGNNATAHTTTLGSSNGSSTTNLQAGSGGVSITSGGNVTIGASDSTGTLLVLDTKNTSGDPTGVNGGLYYNSNTNKLRCYENSSWADCIQGSGGSGWNLTGTNANGSVLGSADATTAGFVISSRPNAVGATSSGASYISFSGNQFSNPNLITISGNSNSNSPQGGGSYSGSHDYFRIQDSSGAVAFAVQGSGGAQQVFAYLSSGSSVGVNSRVCSGLSAGGSGMATLATCTATGTDLAEAYNSTQSLEPGDIVVVDVDNYPNVVRSDSPSQSAIAGIVSTDPDYVMGTQSFPDGYPIALNGRVPTKVNTEGGAIHPGDKITTSSVPGVGKKATGAGMVVGVALTGFDGPGQGTIKVLVQPGYYSPDAASFLQNGDTAQFAGLNVTGPLTADSITIAGDATIEGNIVIEGHIVSGGSAPTIEGTEDVTATVEGTDTAGTIMVIVNTSKPAGSLAGLIFNKVFDLAPNVTLTPDNEAAANVQYYTADRTTSGFSLSSAAALEPGTYKFTYQVIQ